MNKKPLIITLLVLIALSLLMLFVVVIAKKTNSPGITNIISGIKSPQMQGLKIEVLREGAGAEAKTGDRVIIRYTGTFKDGTEFGSNVRESDPLTFVLGENKVIKGWEMGVLGMKTGEKRRLTIPSTLAYGKKGRPPVIGPNETLIFDIELMGILVN